MSVLGNNLLGIARIFLQPFSKKIIFKKCVWKKNIFKNVLGKKNSCSEKIFLLGKIIICSEQSVLGNNVLGIARIFLQP